LSHAERLGGLEAGSDAATGRGEKMNISRRLQPFVLAAALLMLGTSGALAQEAEPPSEVVFLAELIALMLVGRLLGEAMQRLGQPAVMGQLLAGIMLGPSVFGWLSASCCFCC
jgi:hypothetical protein